jgi:hypothetical protein
MSERPPWEEIGYVVPDVPDDKEDDDAGPWNPAAGEAFLRMAGIDVAFARALRALPEDEGRVYDALVARLQEPDATEADRNSLTAAKEQIRRTGRLLRVKPRPNEVRIPRQVQEAMDMLVIIGVPPKDVERIARDDLDDTPAMRSVKAIGSRRMLVLAGERGCGKSIAAAAWLRHFDPTARSRSIRVNGRRFVEADRAHRFDEQKLSELAYAVALVVDDVGVQASDVDDRTMTTLLTRRYRNGLDTVITTNLNPPEFIDRYGDRVYDRICEVGAWLSVGTESLRSRT